MTMPCLLLAGEDDPVYAENQKCSGLYAECLPSSPCPVWAGRRLFPQRFGAASNNSIFGDREPIGRSAFHLAEHGGRRLPLRRLAEIVTHWEDRYFLSPAANGRSLLFPQI